VPGLLRAACAYQGTHPHARTGSGGIDRIFLPYPSLDSQGS